MQRDVSGTNVISGTNVEVKVSISVVIGGANAEVYRGGIVAVGNDTLITKDAVNAIVLSRYAWAEQQGALCVMEQTGQRRLVLR